MKWEKMKTFLLSCCFNVVPYLLQQVCLLNCLQHILFGCLLSLPTQQELIQNKVGLLKVENYVQLTDLLIRNKQN